MGTAPYVLNYTLAFSMALIKKFNRVAHFSKVNNLSWKRSVLHALQTRHRLGLKTPAKKELRRA